MGVLENAIRLVTRPRLARDFFRYGMSKILHKGQAVRELYEGVEVTHFSGFSEYHSCAEFVEEDEHAFLTEYPFSEETFLDVGANLGIVSLVLAHRFPECRIHAFEPNPSTVQALRKNLEYNDVDNVLVQDVAVGEVSGTINFDANPENRGTARRPNEETDYTEEVSCITLDEYVEEQQIEEVTLLKVDVEGYEKAVFEGAERLLSNQRVEVVYFEVCPALSREIGFAPEAAATMLEEFGYRLYRMMPDGNIRTASLSEIEEVELENWIGLSRKHSS